MGKGAERVNQGTKEQNDWNKQMWHEQNEYNSPSAQVERYMQAGINPLFAGVDGGQAQQLNSANLANQVPGQTDPNYKINKFNSELSALGQALQGVDNIFSYQVQAQQLQNESIRLGMQGQDLKSQMAYRAAQTRGQNLANKNYQRSADDAHSQAMATIDNLKANNRLTSDQAEQLEKILPFVERMQDKQLLQLDEAIKGLRLDNAGKVSDNEVKAFKAKLTQSGINPDADGLQQLVQLCITNPGGVGEIINQFTAGLIKSGQDIITNNPVVQKIGDIIDKAEEKIDNFFPYSRSHKNPEHIPERYQTVRDRYGM